MVGTNIEKGKNQYKYKDVIYAQAFLHYISTEVFHGCLLTFHPPHKAAKKQRQHHPEKRLVQSRFDANFRRFFAKDAQIKNQSQKNHDAKNKIRNLICCHFTDL